MQIIAVKQYEIMNIKYKLFKTVDSGLIQYDSLVWEMFCSALVKWLAWVVWSWGWCAQIVAC